MSAIDFLVWCFGSFWRWCGLFLLVGAVGVSIGNAIGALRK